MTSRFESTCNACRNLIHIGDPIAKNAATGRWQHTVCPVAAPPPALRAAVQLDNFAGVIALFDHAKRHLNFPKIRLTCNRTPIILSVAGARAAQPGTVNVCGEGKYPARAFYGRVNVDGTWEPARAGNDAFLTALGVLLNGLAKEPARVAAVYGKLTGNCCFCNLKLSDARSTAAGFGPICADHYGLSEEWYQAARVQPALPIAFVTINEMETPAWAA